MNKLLILIPLALIGCRPAPLASMETVAGTTWHFTAIDGQPPVAGETHLTFRNGNLGAKVGCNGLGGDFRIEKGRLVAGPIIATMMYCEGVMEQEQAVAALLAENPRIRLRGSLMTLNGTKHSAELHLED